MNDLEGSFYHERASRSGGLPRPLIDDAGVHFLEVGEIDLASPKKVPTATAPHGTLAAQLLIALP